MSIDLRRGWSLRRRLLSIASVASLATLLLGGVAMFVAAQTEDQKLLDARLADLGRTIMAFSAHEIAEIIAEGRTEMIHVETAATLGDRYDYQIWSAQTQQLLLRSHLAPGRTPLAPLSATGFSTTLVDGETHRVFTIQQGDMVMQVAECLDDRVSAVGTVSFYFLAFLVIPFAVIGVVTWWLLTRSLASIDGSARELSRRSPIDLSPLQAVDPPKEIQPVLTAINSLLGRIREAMSVERGFTALAAHELRSPLAGLRAQAQIATMAKDSAERDTALRSVMQGVDRCAHMLEQLLDLTRSEGLTDPGRRQMDSVDLERVVHYALLELQGEIDRRRIELSVDLRARYVSGIEWGLVLLLRNLVSNAVRHTPQGSRVDISSAQIGTHVSLSVDDSGPGIPPDDRIRVYERFERLGRTDGQGVGLGMAIVRSIIESHQATIHLLDSPLGGLRAQVLLSVVEPPAPAEPSASLSIAK